MNKSLDCVQESLDIAQKDFWDNPVILTVLMDLILGPLVALMVLGNLTLLVKGTSERPKMVAMGAQGPLVDPETGPQKPFWESNPRTLQDPKVLGIAELGLLLLGIFHSDLLK